jgi:hypothetical protein
MLLRYLFTLLLFCFVSAASPCKAVLIEANFAGDASVPYFEGSILHSFHTTFTAHFVFDTALSTVEQIAPGAYRLTQLNGPPFVSGSLTLAASYPPLGGGPYTFGFQGIGSLVWQDGSGPTLASVQNSGFLQDIFVQLGGSGEFQNGTCPALLHPCGTTFANSSELIGTFPVPVPVAGAGVPGFVMAVATFIGLRRWRRAITA